MSLGTHCSSFKTKKLWQITIVTGKMPIGNSMTGMTTSVVTRVAMKKNRIIRFQKIADTERVAEVCALAMAAGKADMNDK